MTTNHQLLSEPAIILDNTTFEIKKDEDQSLAIRPNDELEKEVNKNKEKFKLLYEVAIQEYKDVTTHVNSITPKVISFFTILNVILTLCVAFVSNQQFITFIGNSSKIVQVSLVILIAFTFIFLLIAWYFFFGYLRSSKFIKIDLKEESNIVKTVYDDNLDINYLYFLLYKNYQQAIETNTNIADATLKSLDTGWIFIKIAFILIFFIGIILYTNSLFLLLS